MTDLNLITSPQAAVILGKSVRTVHRLVEAGELSATKLPGPNGPFLYHRADVEALAAKLAADRESVA